MPVQRRLPRTGEGRHSLREGISIKLDPLGVFFPILKITNPQSQQHSRLKNRTYEPLFP
jgi:hypothetical protein